MIANRYQIVLSYYQRKKEITRFSGRWGTKMKNSGWPNPEVLKNSGCTEAHKLKIVDARRRIIENSGCTEAYNRK